MLERNVGNQGNNQQNADPADNLPQLAGGLLRLGVDLDGHDRFGRVHEGVAVRDHGLCVVDVRFGRWFCAVCVVLDNGLKSVDWLQRDGLRRGWHRLRLRFWCRGRCGGRLFFLVHQKQVILLNLDPTSLSFDTKAESEIFLILIGFSFLKRNLYLEHLRLQGWNSVQSEMALISVNTSTVDVLAFPFDNDRLENL